jgi:para-aminobenzoate synthetase component 1
LPDLGVRLLGLTRPADLSVWLRLEDGEQEVFAAFPHRGLVLSDQGFKEGNQSLLLQLCNWSDFWRAAASLLETLPAGDELKDMPYRGGLMGLLGYGHSPGQSAQAFPTAYMGVYPQFVHLDHNRRKAEFIALPGFDIPSAWQELLESVTRLTRPATGFHLTSPFSPLTSPDLYRKHFQRIQHYLYSGDCYQVNYAQAFRANCRGNSAAAMDRLLAESDPAHAAWVSLPEGDVLSLSPELFLRVKNGRITTRPIKGTAPRSPDAAVDAQLRAELAASAKNRAENLMIVDLLRHDLGKHAETGSVKTEKLFEVESLPQVHHLVSTVTAQLQKGSHILDLVRDAFPGGSITGAPKKRAMEIIEELEPTPRSVYCGSIGFINADGDAELNIAIRTMLRLDEEIYAWAGGGIVADSDCEAEYQECFDKIGALMRALETMGR